MKEVEEKQVAKEVETAVTAFTTTQENASPVYRSQDLLQGKRELFILHGNEVYHLIRTRNNKLILQK